MKRIDVILMLALFISALIFRLAFIIPYDFDGLYGQDAYAYYQFAGELGTVISEGRAPEPFFWSLGYPVTLMIAFTVTETQETTAQAVSILMGASLTSMIYALTYLISRHRFSATLAGLLMLICGQAVQSSIVIMSDIPALFWATGSAIALLHWKQGQQFRYLLIVAILLTFGGLTRWLVLILIPAWSLVVLNQWQWRINMRQTIIISAVVTLMFLPQIAFSLNNPFPTLNHAWVENWSPRNAFSRTFTNIDGQFTYAQINARYYAQIYSDAYYLASIFTPFIALGLWALWQKRRLTTLMMLVIWAFLPYLFLIGIPYQNIRFPLIAMPAIFVLIGTGISWILEVQPAKKRPYLTYGILSILLVFGMWQMTTTTTSTVEQFVSNQQRDKDIAQWAITQLPDDALLYTFGLTLTLQHYSTMEVYEIYYETPQTLADAWTPGHADYLLLNVWQIENQWDGREPQTVYHWFRDVRGLTRIERHGNYTLFRIRG